MIYSIAVANERGGKICANKQESLNDDVYCMSATGDVLMMDEGMKTRWGQYFNWLMNEENPRKRCQ